MTTWGDLHAGDVVKARTGSAWQVQRWEDVAGQRWLAAGGGGRERVFTLAPVDGSRAPITAPHVLSDPVVRVFEHDQQETRTAMTALSAAFSLTILSEGEAPMTQTGTQTGCRHPDEQRSNLKDGRIYCTSCFTGIGHLSDPVLDQQLGEAAGLAVPASTVPIVHPPQCVCPRPECVARFGDAVRPPAPTLIEVPPYQGLDASGVEYIIPARERREACDKGIHPVSALGPPTSLAPLSISRMWVRPCSACGLVMALTAGYVTELGLDQPVTLNVLDPMPPAQVDLQPLNPWDPARDKTALPLVPAQPAQTPVAPMDPATDPVAPAGPATAVTVTTDRPAGPVDVFADPAPHFPVKRDRWGRYVLPHPVTGVEQGWTRASTLARAMADEYHLTRWKQRMTGRGVALNRDLIAGFAAADADDKATMNSLVEKAMERAESSAGATLGTALHNFTHRLDRGEPLSALRAPDPLGADLVEYQATLKRHGLTVVSDLIERIVVCPQLNAAGTFDRIIGQRPGPWSSCPLSVLDLKTAKSMEWGWLEIAVQLAIYSNATHMWDPASGTYIPMPPREVLDRERALVLHLPVGVATGTMYGVNLIEGWEAALVSEQVRQYRNSSKGYGWLVNPVDPAALLLHRVSQADGPELARLWERHYPAGEWTDAVAQAAELRVARLGSVPA
jgi:hypothetical protein